MYRRSPVSLYKLLTRRSVLSHQLPDVVPSAKAYVLQSPISRFLHFSNLNHPNPQLQFPILQTLKRYSNQSENKSTPEVEVDVDREVDMINLKFVQAREEIEIAMESKETVYFDEEAEYARVEVKEVMDMFESLLGKVTETQKGVLQRSMGLKMEQLKAELNQLND